MLAIIFGLLSVFYTSHGQAKSPGNALAIDSVKRLHKQNINSDSTGKFVEINRIFITGNRITRDQIISRELSLKPGDVVFSGDLPGIFDLDRKKLINTRLFNTVEITILQLAPDKFDLLVHVSERWYTFPVPVFELSDRNFNEWWQNYGHSFKRINYGLRLYQYNMRGRNETLRLHAQSGFLQKYDLVYNFPYIDKKQKQGLNINIGFFETKNPTFQTTDHKYVFAKSDRILKTDRYAGLVYTYRNSFYQFHSIELKYKSTHLDDTFKILNPNFLKGEKNIQSYTSITYQFNADHRDYFAYPLKGHQVVFAATKTGLGLGDDVNKTEINLLYSQYFDLKKKYYLSNNFNIYWSNPANLSYINYGVLGLRKQFVRGYEIYVIEGPYYFLNKTTFKKLLFSRKYRFEHMPIEQFKYFPLSIYLKTYADIAYVKNYTYYEQQNLNTTLTDKLLSGAGFGIDVVGSYDMVLRFEYTFNAQGQHGFFFHVKKEF
jgi:outer membrane protein assembly factor BamA